MRFETSTLSVERLLARRRVNTETNCWIWTGKTLKRRGGYGVLTCNYRTLRVHRVAAHIFMGMDLRDAREVMHSCDNPACFNPQHLRLGDHAENMAEMRDRKRHAVGIRHGRGGHKLTWESVRQIRSMYRRGNGAELSVQFKIDRSVITRIASRKSWWPEP